MDEEEEEEKENREERKKIGSECRWKKKGKRRKKHTG